MGFQGFGGSVLGFPGGSGSSRNMGRRILGAGTDAVAVADAAAVEVITCHIILKIRTIIHD